MLQSALGAAAWPNIFSRAAMDSAEAMASRDSLSSAGLAFSEAAGASVGSELATRASRGATLGAAAREDLGGGRTFHDARRASRRVERAKALTSAQVGAAHERERE